VRRWLIRLLRQLADRLELPLLSELQNHARDQTAFWEQRLGAGFGEAKRHAVYAALIKAFPEEDKRVISRVIEDSLP